MQVWACVCMCGCVHFCSAYVCVCVWRDVVVGFECYFVGLV